MQSFATEVAAGATTRADLDAHRVRAPTCIESGTHPSIQGPMGLYGMLVVTTRQSRPSGCDTAYRHRHYSRRDLRRGSSAAAQRNRPGAEHCGQHRGQHRGFQRDHGLVRPAGRLRQSRLGDLPHTCYPPAVNYTPLYYLINGVAFDRANARLRYFATVPPATGVTGTTSWCAS